MLNQDSPFFRFFKAKFFPNGLVFDAKENKGFYTWKSILKGRDVIREGMRWRIGDWSSVWIYQDRWLPVAEHNRIISPIVEITLDASVSILINHDLCCWREAKIDRLFLPLEASIIKAFSLSFSNRCDTIF